MQQINASVSARKFAFIIAIFIPAGLFSCSSAIVNSKPKRLYFTPSDTIIISGLNPGNPEFVKEAEEAMLKTFEKCQVAQVLPATIFQETLIRKIARKEIELSNPESLALLKQIGLTGYLVDATITSFSDENSYLNFVPQSNENQVAPPLADPWIEFRFRIYHINTNLLALEAHIRITSNNFRVGESLDDNILVNRGIYEPAPMHELKKALKKMNKICHCKGQPY